MRLFKTLLFAACAAAAAACSAATEPASSFELGKQYQQVREPATPADPKKISVEEFFCFCCPHCYAVEPRVEDWRQHKPADVDFQFVPNTLGRPDGEVEARAFYIAQALNVEDQIHLPMFRAIHDQHVPMNLDAARLLFTEVAGVKPADFDAMSSSFIVDAKLRGAENAARAYGIASTPSFVVGGKYVVSGGSPELVKILDYLVDKVRKERKA